MDAHDLIESFSIKYKGDSIKEFDDRFREFCMQNNIGQKEFNKWKQDFRMFIYENPSFSYSGGIGWARQYLLDNYVF